MQQATQEVAPHPWKNFKKNDKKTEENGQTQKKSFDFPDGGWECNKCQNYNFKGRKSCFRCKKAKSDDDFVGKPEHMTNPKAKKVVSKKNMKTTEGEDTVTNENSSVDFNTFPK